MAGEAKPGFYVAVAVVVLGLVGFAYYRYTSTSPLQSSSPATATDTTNKPTETQANELEGKLAASVEIPDLGPAGTYQLQGDTLDVEISDWPGYAPLIVANGGLEPNPDSYFFRKYGFKLKISVSEAEAEAWQAINSGKNAVTVTTVDVLALYADQLKVEVPIQLDFSRGGDGILTRKDITRILLSPFFRLLTKTSAASNAVVVNNKLMRSGSGGSLIPCSGFTAKPASWARKRMKKSDSVNCATVRILPLS